MSWNINSFEDINEKTLSLFCVLDPKIDVLVIGTGDMPITPAFSKKIMGFMKKYGINVEVLPTEQACTTFNFLNGENRMVAAAMLPPVFLSVNEADYVRHSLDRKRLLEIDD
jgi:NADH dehydrogenase [ubiquinone] 1 alpha subcomplex assembly factor 3